MKQRRLDGGSKELGALIRHSLQGAFPGVEFILESLDLAEFGIYWRHKAPGAPSEKDVRVQMAVSSPNIDVKLKDSDGRAIGGRTAGATEIDSTPQSLKRRIEGDQSEPSTLIIRGLQANFPCTEFFVTATSADDYIIYWRHLDTAPEDATVLGHLASKWPSFKFTADESEGKTLAGKTAGVAGGVGGAAGIFPGDAAKLIASLKPKKKSGKVCRKCGGENRKSARGCVHCGICFPYCVQCDALLNDEDKFCGKCGLPRCSYA